MRNVINEYLSQFDLDIRKSHDARFVDQKCTPDIVCFTLEKALSELDMIDARETSEELVNEIFSRFCVGK